MERRLKNEFGIKPTIGWQIDPFGQSKVEVSVLIAMGYDGLISNRIPSIIKDQMASDYGFTLSWNAYDISWEKDVGLPTHYLEHFFFSTSRKMFLS